ncbi:putative xanthine dehydrogenase accessory factor [Crocosphaera subtropica ATCC 51142]|uniref:Xanthine dehydrogenase accessory factor n=1 Tax=Crocosphaera subtropica (strain ATCC 51142 / BH68) TaxID=43989 RepID=B1WYA2_CROS5|nr:XdhC/CoxI family protein [Crocosphaera subtropica]ACB52686.1 putative xanthine dehydrogenase accessory factor [Crocosphaera subtropica ATCC 51142]
MKEIKAILAAWKTYKNQQEEIFLSTIVKTKGSTYRQAGARMLITSSGAMIGSISGGCLEKDILEHTRVSITENSPILVTYDTTADEDIIWGFGLGCNGVVNVLIEKLDPNDCLNPLQFIDYCLKIQRPGIIATIFNVEGAVNSKVGKRLTVILDDQVKTDIKDNNLSFTLLKDAQTCLQNQQSSVYCYQFPQGKIDVFMELIKPPPNLIIFGAGRDVIPVVELAKILGWNITIFDCRGSQETKKRFIMVDEIILTRRDILHKQISVNDDTVVIVMTHNYLDDLEILKLLIPSQIKYLGCLGSKQRKERLLQDLQNQGSNYSPEMLEKLYAPIGLDIGAETPEAIALSIVTEIQAILTNRQGGFLKQRLQPLHVPNQVRKVQLGN